MAQAAPNGKTLDNVDSMGLLLQMAGKLMFASANLLSEREIYAGAALLRQVIEIEYLTWAIKENYRTAENWLRSTHEERMASFSPVQLRRTSKGRFLDKDYRNHCELGGHPTPRGIVLLGGKEMGMAQGNLVDLLIHCWRIRVYVHRELQGSKKRRGNINDPLYEDLVTDLIQDQTIDFVFEEATGLGPTTAEHLSAKLVGANRYLDLDPPMQERHIFGIPPGSKIRVENHCP